MAFGAALLPAQAAPLYWDINGATPGSGGPTPTGAWNTTNTFWNSASSGDGSGTISAWVNGSDAVFSAGTDATGTYSVTPNSTVTSVNSLTYDDTSGAGTGLLTIETGATILNQTGVIAVNGQAASRLAFNAIFGGANGLTKTGAGILQFNSGIPNYTGNTFITEGTLRLSAAGRLPTATSVDISTGANLDIRGNTTISGLTGLGSVYEGQSNRAATLTLSAATGTKTFEGQITRPVTTGTLHLTKSGAYTQILGGESANVYTGNTLISAGTLALAKTAGVDAISGGTVEVATGATLRLDAANQINDSAALKLSGGTLDLNGTAGETFSTALSLNSNSVIHFGTGTNTLAFAASNAENWESFTITVTGFTNGVDLLQFGISGGGLTEAQLALFRFADYGDAVARIDAFGFITPDVVPEPGSVLLLGGGALLLLLRRQRKTSRCALNS